MRYQHTCRIFAQKISIFPVSCRSDRSLGKSSATVWTYVIQNTVNTIGTEGTFKRTNACVNGFRWQTAIAVFACRSQFKHCSPDSAVPI